MLSTQMSRMAQHVEEVVDGEPVVGSAATLTVPTPAPVLVERTPASVPARQVAALAATSFVAGAAAVAVASGRGPRLLSRRRRRRKGLVGEIVSSNSFLVDVHLIRRS